MDWTENVGAERDGVPKEEGGANCAVKNLHHAGDDDEEFLALRCASVPRFMNLIQRHK